MSLPGGLQAPDNSVPNEPPPARKVNPSRRAIAPLNWFFLAVLIMVPAAIWLASHRSSPTRPVLVALRPIGAYTIVGPSDVSIQMRPVEPDQLPASASLGLLITTKSVVAGHSLLSTDTADLGSSDLPQDPVVVRVPDSSLPVGASAGRPITVYGTWKGRPFTVSAVLLELEPVTSGGSDPTAVVMAERSQIRRYGQALLRPGSILVAGIGSP